MYKLQTQIKWRDTKSQEDHLITELPLPDIVTVAQSRAIHGANEFELAHNMAVVLGGLKTPQQKNGLEIPDALGYMAALTDAGLFDDSQVEAFDFDVSTIKPVLALVKKLTCTMDKQTEFVCQVLEASGCDKAKLNTADIRSLRQIMPAVIGVFMPAAKT